MANITYPKNYALGLPDTHAFPKVQYAKIIEIIDRLNAITSGTVTVTDVELGDGTASLPSLTFANDLNTGIYRIGADNIGISLGGTKYVDLAANLAAFTGAITASTTITAATSVKAPLFDTATAVAMTIGTTASSVTITPATTITGLLTATGGITSVAGAQFYSGTAVPAGGTAGSGVKFSSTSNLGIFFGSGAPTLAAAQGSVYVRTDGSSTSTRLYINTNGSTTWTNVTTAA